MAIFIMFRTYLLLKIDRFRYYIRERGVNIGTTAGDMHHELARLYHPLVCIGIKESQHVGCNGKGDLLGLAWLQSKFSKTFEFFFRTSN